MNIELLYQRLRVVPESLREFCKDSKIVQLALFGSILRDNFNPDSDVDIIVTFADDYIPNLFDFFDLEDKFKTLFNRDVDLLEKSSIENDPNWLRRREILNSAVVIYES